MLESFAGLPAVGQDKIKALKVGTERTAIRLCFAIDAALDYVAEDQVEGKNLKAGFWFDFYQNLHLVRL